MMNDRKGMLSAERATENWIFGCVCVCSGEVQCSVLLHKYEFPSKKLNLSRFWDLFG